MCITSVLPIHVCSVSWRHPQTTGVQSALTLLSACEDGYYYSFVQLVLPISFTAFHGPFRGQKRAPALADELGAVLETDLKDFKNTGRYFTHIIHCHPLLADRKSVLSPRNFVSVCD